MTFTVIILKKSMVGKFRTPQWPWDEHDCETNAGQLLCKNKNKRGKFAAE